MNFRGYDWRELFQAWNLQIEEIELPEFEGQVPDIGKMDDYRTEDGHLNWSAWFDAEASEEYKDYLSEFGNISDKIEKAEQDAIIDYMFESLDNGTSERVASELKSFINALYEQSVGHDFFHPVWKGLLEVEDEYTLFQLVSQLLPTMWT